MFRVDNIWVMIHFDIFCLLMCVFIPLVSPGGSAACGIIESIPGLGDPLEEGRITHSSILAWRISRPEEPGGPQSMRLQRDTTDIVQLIPSIFVTTFYVLYLFFVPIFVLSVALILFIFAFFPFLAYQLYLLFAIYIYNKSKST